jgi:carbonic anhydrase
MDQSPFATRKLLIGFVFFILSPNWGTSDALVWAQSEHPGATKTPASRSGAVQPKMSVEQSTSHGTGAPPSHGSSPHWEYAGESGPSVWSTLAPEFALCGSGNSQSPVDLQRVYSGTDPKILFNYRTSKLRVVNNGHTVQVNYEPGSNIKIDDRTYELIQFHFHTPSEHTIKGQTSEMEVHFVHRSADGALAVVGVMMHSGNVNEGLQAVWEHLPGLAGEERTYQTVTVNAADLLPATGAYYLYGGSLTTPPCTEGVRWQVMQSPIEVSDAQIMAFRRLFPLNARPVQPLKDRFVIAVSGAK